MRFKFKKILKIALLLLILLISVLVFLFYRLSTPMSDDKIIAEFKNNNVDVFLKYKKFENFSYRVLDFQQELDTTKVNLVFIHGSIGSAKDFMAYCSDSELLKNANIRAYDRIGYGLRYTGNTPASIAIERLHLEDVIADMKKSRTILVGYSYGGPIALYSTDLFKKIVLIAPAVHAESEHVPWAINFYKWKVTNWMLPKTWKAASKEKIGHKADLKKVEGSWKNNPSPIISVHGNEDGIVPIENSYFLKEIYSPEQFEMLTLDGVGHGLVWSQYNTIVQLLRDALN